MKRLLLAVYLLSTVTSSAQTYKNPKVPAAQRAADLLQRMTLEEKLAQMTMHNLEGFKNRAVGYGVCESPFIEVAAIASQSYATKKYAREKTRLGIPPFQIAECLHGLLAFGATIFPQAIAQGSTWNTTLIKEMGEAIAREANAVGVDQALSPLFDLIIDPRFGRVEECFGEDPYHVALMGGAFVMGMQPKVMCTAKHFAGYSVPAGGINLGPSSLGEREMRSLHLFPFEYAVKQAKIFSVMPSYNEVDGIPAHANKWLLDEVLRKEWGFKGYVFSDYGGLSMLCDFHKTAKDRPAAAVMALDAGVDVEASRPDVFYHLTRMVQEKELPMAVIDTAVMRILTAKFAAGLFEKALPDTNYIKRSIHTPAHIRLARQLAEESVILLKNDQLLPLDPKKVRSLAVIGPNADQVQYGDYSYTRDNKSGVTILKGLQAYAQAGMNIRYAKGCDITGNDKSGFSAAINAARESDAVVLVVGETSAVLSGLGWGVGPGENEPKDPFTGGEGYDVTSLQPMGVQGELIREIQKTGKPVILVMVHGRPWSIAWEKANIPAILEAWYPGEQGGNAIADIIFGKVNPSGRLNVSIPQSAGHIPVHYNYKPSGKGYYHQPGTPEKPGRDYVFSSSDALFPFGFGLSYTNFSYSNLQLSSPILKDSITVSVDIKNTGSMAGKEVVQLYVNDKVSTVTTPVIALKGFSKIALSPGESRTVKFVLKVTDLSLWNRDMKQVTEPGEFRIMVGKSAAEILLDATLTY
jgi:beta-glucosidase